MGRTVAQRKQQSSDLLRVGFSEEVSQCGLLLWTKRTSINSARSVHGLTITGSVSQIITKNPPYVAELLSELGNRIRAQFPPKITRKALANVFTGILYSGADIM